MHSNQDIEFSVFSRLFQAEVKFQTESGRLVLTNHSFLSKFLVFAYSGGFIERTMLKWLESEIRTKGIQLLKLLLR